MSSPMDIPNSPKATSPVEPHAPSSFPDKRSRPRRSSSVSRVSVEFFDADGVQQLRQVLASAPAEGHASTSGGKEEKEKAVRDSFGSSTSTLQVGHDHTDFGRTARQILKRFSKAQIKPRELGVMFRDLRVVGIGASMSYQSTLGSMISPFHVLEAVRKLRHPPIRDILSGFEGVVRPGEMLLVLGSPGSGCSTLLKILANQRSDYHAVEGDVFYDSILPEDLRRHYRGDVQYNPEDDIHFPTLSVDQTLSFAIKTRTPHTRIHKSRKEFIKLATDILAAVFGLRHAMKTPVGDAAVRGVSGGEKKRVSIAEALASRSCLNAWDNSTRGLDASTALEFVRALRIATDTFHTTNIVSIYQAGESLYKHFDKVCVINQGQMSYFGPADQAKQYFIDMGYEPANRQTTADFLVSVTDPNGRITRPGVQSIPRTAAEFAEYFKKSALGRRNRDDMDSYYSEFVGVPNRASAYMESALSEHAKNTRKESPYMLSIPMQARAVMLRRVQILRGNMLSVGLNIFSFIFQALIVGSVFVKVPETTDAYFSRGGVIFFALLFSALTTMAEIPALFHQRPIVLRHEKAALYHPFIEAVALTLVDIPITFLTSITFSIILYFIVQLQQTAGQFFIFYLLLFTMSITMKAWFRGIASAFKSEATATSFAGISILALTLYTGYVIPKPSMIGALRWITYINPLRYGFEAMLTNEFYTLDGSCSTIIPQGPGYENVSLSNQVCTVVGSQLGQSTVNGNRFTELSYGFSHSNTWRNFGIIVAFGIAFIGALLVLTEFNTASENETAVVLFKRRSNALKDPTAAADEEALERNERPGNERADNAEVQRAVEAQPAMTDVFSWQHINYTVPIHGHDDRRLLDDVSGFVAPGKLTALMGESGAGKTTLLNVLAQRVSIGVVTGDKFVNGQALPADFQSQTGYCQQMDTHVATSTVREALLFSANLRQPKSVPKAEKEAYVETCLKMCGLEAYGDAIVGSLGIEHRKRTTIGVELAAKPKLLLFLDEPTSGLDSQSAWAVMSFLRTLADNGQAILCTIHQPSAELFQVFDRMMLLRKGGQTVYFGDLGRNATTLINYFEKNGSRPCLSDENPAEFMLDVIGAGATASSALDWHQIWSASPEAKEVQQAIDNIHAEGRNRSAAKAAVHTEFATSWFNQTYELLKRDASAHWRSPTYLAAKLVLNVVGGLFIGFTFFRSKDSQQGTQNKLFSIFMLLILSVPLSNQLQSVFITMRSVYEIRERPSRMYSWTALITSQLLIELPWNIFGSSLMFLTWYWTAGFETSRAGFTYLMLSVVFPIYYTTIAQAVAAMSPTTEISAMLFSLLFSFVITFNGVLQPFRQLGWWQWMYRICPFTYLVEGILGQAIGRQDINCAAVEFVTLNPPSGQTCGQYLQPFISFAGGYLTNSDATSSCQYCSMRTTDEFMETAFNIYYDNHWRDFGIVMGFILFNTVCIYLFTYFFRIRTGSLLPSFKRATKSS